MLVPPCFDLGRPAHLLLVDDSPMNLTIMKACCDLFGSTHESARDGVEAVAAVQQASYDAILMDIRMPRMDGLQASQLIRLLPGKSGSTPIIGVTGEITRISLRNCLIVGMATVIEKPVRIELLFRALKEVLGSTVLVD